MSQETSNHANIQAVNDYLDSVCQHLDMRLDGRGNLLCAVCGKVEKEEHE